jgi:hypothetical protein
LASYFKGKHRLGVLENRLVRRILGPRRENVTTGTS